jgi:MEDS: MEthanogen/methylotroph, DcmR Sensory domain/Bacterial regulatory proteins, luxR family
MRASGDAFWLQPTDRNAFLDYEADLTYMIAYEPITLLCTYPLSVSKAGNLADVARVHHIAIAKRKTDWEVIKGWEPAKRPVADQRRRAEALDAATRILSLSERERQVLDAVAEGLSNKAIAEAGAPLSSCSTQARPSRRSPREELQRACETAGGDQRVVLLPSEVEGLAWIEPRGGEELPVCSITPAI